MAAVGGTVAAVIGMMWASVWLLVRPYVGGLRRTLRIALFAGGAFLALWKFGITPVPIIAASALIGLLWKDRDPA